MCLRNAKPPITASTTTGMIELVRNGSTILFGMRPSKSSRKCTGRTPRTTSRDTRASVGIERYRPGISVLESVSAITTASVALTAEIPNMSRPDFARTVVRRKASITAKRIRGAAKVLMRPITTFPISPIPPARGPATTPKRPPRTMASRMRKVGETRTGKRLVCDCFISWLSDEETIG